MQKDLYDYFIDLNKSDLNKDKGVFIEDLEYIQSKYHNPKRAKILDGEFYAKRMANIPSNLNAQVSSEIYNNAGIISPPIYIFKNTQNEIYQVSEDVKTLKRFDCCIHPVHVQSLFNERFCKKNEYQRTENSWKAITNKKYKNFFLSIMTEECYEQLQTMFLIDELRTDTDRHILNYFLYKQNGSDKYTGVIVIDLDSAEVLSHGIKNKKTFNIFLNQEYFSSTMDFRCKIDNYPNRLLEIKKLIYDNKLSKDTLKKLKDMLNFDTPKRIQELGKELELPPKDLNTIYNPISYLQNYTRKELQHDLDL